MSSKLNLCVAEMHKEVEWYFAVGFVCVCVSLERKVWRKDQVQYTHGGVWESVCAMPLGRCASAAIQHTALPLPSTYMRWDRLWPCDSVGMGNRMIRTVDDSEMARLLDDGTMLHVSH